MRQFADGTALSRPTGSGILRGPRPDIKLCIAILAGLAAVPASAADWPQILGPKRNGAAADDENLAAQWPSGGPAKVWERPVGPGVAGVAVVGTRVFLFHRVDENEVLEALDAATGNSIWKQSSPTTFYPQVGTAGDGPLCVPTVVGDQVITFGAQGLLTAVNAANGDVLWQRETHKDFGAQEGYFGAGSSPLVADDLVIVNVGGSRKEAGIVGFDLKTGETRWTRTAEQASYSAPILTAFDGGNKGRLEDAVPVVIAVTRLKCVALDPKTGAIFWQFAFGQRGPTVNGAVPVIYFEPEKRETHMFLTASYGIGANDSTIGVTGFKPVWEKDGVLSSQYATPIEHEGFLYGIHGRDDLPPSDLVCIDPKTGKVQWSEPNFGYATLLKADNKLIVVKTNGEVVLSLLSPEGFRPRSKARVLKGVVRALPALSNGGLYLRNEDTLVRLNVAAE